MKKLFFILFFIYFLNIINSQNNFSDYENLIDCRFLPKTANDKGKYYSHLGSWFGFSLPQKTDSANFGAFGGPYNIFTEQWLSKKLFQAGVEIKGKGKLKFSDAKNIVIKQMPGMFYQKYDFENFNFTQRLAFSSAKTCIYVSELVNTSNQIINVNISCSGELFPNLGEAKEAQNAWLVDLNSTDDGFFIMQFRVEGKLNLGYSESNYTISFRDYNTLKPNDTIRIVSSLSYFFKFDKKDDVALTIEALNDFNKIFRENETYWNKYIDLFYTKKIVKPDLAIKAIETLMMNFKIPSGTYNNLIIPASNHDIFKGYKLEDVFIFCMVFNLLDTKLASNQLQSFLYWFWNKKTDRLTNEFYFRKNDSLLHSYSDFNLGPWLAWNIYQFDKSNVKLLDETIAELETLNDFWNSNRDANNNFWYENDNNIETVKGNACLFTEKSTLKKIFKELGYDKKSDKYNGEILFFQQNFDKYFFDEFAGEYCDIGIVEQKLYPNKKAFPFVIWAGLGAYSTVEKYLQKNYSEYKIQADNKAFFEKENLMSYYFLLSGLCLYKYNDLAKDIKNQCLEKIYSETQQSPFFIYEKNEKKIENSSVAAALTLMFMLYF